MHWRAAVDCGAAVGMYCVDIAAIAPVLANRIGMKQKLWLCAHDHLRLSRRMRLVWYRLDQGLAVRLR